MAWSKKGRGEEKENKEKAVVQLSTLRVREIPFLFKIRQRTQCRTASSVFSRHIQLLSHFNKQTLQIYFNPLIVVLILFDVGLFLICKRWPSHPTKGMMNQRGQRSFTGQSFSWTLYSFGFFSFFFYFFLLIMHFSAVLSSLPSLLNLSGVPLSSDLCPA